MRSLVAASLLVLGVALLGGSVATHTYADPYEPEYEHELHVTHESTDVYAEKLEDRALGPADAIDREDLAPITREFFDRTLETGEPPDEWGTNETGYRKWTPNVCREFLLTCVNGYEKTPPEFGPNEHSERPRYTDRILVDHAPDGASADETETYLFTTTPATVYSVSILGVAQRAIGLFAPGVALLALSRRASRLSRHETAALVVGAGAMVLWALGTPYLAMYGLEATLAGRTGLAAGVAYVGAVSAIYRRVT